MKIRLSLAIILCLSLGGCKTSKSAEKSVGISSFPGPPTILYKMKKDYSQYVPVMLSNDRTMIVNYPAIEDVGLNGNYPLPTLLKNGYYLDNRGIGSNVAFTKYNYQEYSKLVATPSVKDLLTSIIDKDPIIEMYDCGNRLLFANIEADLNQIIEKGELAKKCKKLK